MLMTAKIGVQLYHVKQACQILNMQQWQYQVKHSLVNISTTVCKGNLCITNTDPDFHSLSVPPVLLFLAGHCYTLPTLYSLHHAELC